MTKLIKENQLFINNKFFPLIMNKINLNESQLNKIIKKAINETLNTPQLNVIDKTQSLIDTLNSSYNELSQEYGGDKQVCMDKNGTFYGFTKPVTIKNNGYISFPYDQNIYGYEPMQIRTFTKAGGKIKYYKDELHYDNDCRDALKTIKTIIKDIQRGRQHLEGYDVSWEDEDNPTGKQKIKQFNKSIGIKNNPSY
jgi:hypothetical protein